MTATADPLRLQSVSALPGHCLRAVFGDGLKADIQLGHWIASTRALQPLSDNALFARARLGDFGTSVVWGDDDIELGADNLRNLAVEQAGGIGHERLLTWMQEARLRQERAADAIGISRRMLNYYLSGAKPIPKTVWLACVGWESQQRKRRRHAGKRSPVDSNVAA